MIKLVAASLFMSLGIFVFLTEVVGLFKFDYVMQRIHAVGLGDTLGISSIAIAAAILIGTPNAILKLILVVAFMMISNPVLTHLLSNVEVKLHNNSCNEYDEEDRT